MYASPVLFRMPPRRRLHWLSRQLREPMPEGFEWNYGSLRQCALGLYARHKGVSVNSLTRREFGLNGAAYVNIFLFATPIRLHRITPTEIADRIDATLARKQRYGRWADLYEAARMIAICVLLPMVLALAIYMALLALVLIGVSKTIKWLATMLRKPQPLASPQGA